MTTANEKAVSPFYGCYLFDFDYTLADSSKGITGCFHLAMESCGLPPVDDETITDDSGGSWMDLLPGTVTELFGI